MARVVVGAAPCRHVLSTRVRVSLADDLRRRIMVTMVTVGGVRVRLLDIGLLGVGLLWVRLLGVWLLDIDVGRFSIGGALISGRSTRVLALCVGHGWWVRDRDKGVGLLI